MKVISDSLKARFLLEATSIAVLWRIQRKDGQIIALTNTNRDIVFMGETYTAVEGFNSSDIAFKLDFSVTNLEVDGLIGTVISREDILYNKLDGSLIKIYYVDYQAPELGGVLMLEGLIGETSLKEGGFTAEIRGKSEKIQRKSIQVYSPFCRAKLGDARCTVNIAPYTHSGIVSSVDSRTLFYASALTQPNSYYANGYLEWTSGNNNGLSMEIKSFLNKRIGLVLPMPYEIEIGDTFSAVRGCNKSVTECKNTFSNLVNFRGEPYVPGTDAIYTTATTRK